MAVMDEFKEERAKLKDASLKEKLNYFWYYYKWHTIATVAVIVLLTSFIHDLATRKDTVFRVAVVNHFALTTPSENYVKALEDYLGIDTAHEEIFVDSNFTIDLSSYSQQSINSTEKLIAQAASKSLDVLIADETVFAQYASNAFCYDLSALLSEEELAKFEPYLYYAETEEGTFPAGIYMDNCTQFLETYLPRENTRSVLGVFANTPNTEYVLQFIHYLFLYS